jgi:hypothetical protein
MNFIAVLFIIKDVNQLKSLLISWVDEQKVVHQAGMVVHTYYPSTQAAEAEGS